MFLRVKYTQLGHEYETLPSDSPPHVQSKLIIKKTKEHDFGTYQVSHIYNVPITPSSAKCVKFVSVWDTKWINLHICLEWRSKTLISV